MESSNSIWALVISTSGMKYVGRVLFNPGDDDDTPESLVLQDLEADDFIKLKGAICFDESKIPMPNPNNPGQIVINRSVNVSPVGFSMDPENMTIRVRVADISFFSDMSSMDRAAYEQAVRDGYDMILRARAAKAGLTLGGTPPEPGAH